MRDVLHKMGKHGLAFAIGLMLTRLVGFFVMPFLQRAMPPADYGVANNLALASSLIMMLAAQAVPSGLFRAYAYSARTDEEKGVVIATAFRYTLVCSVLVALVCGLASTKFSKAVTGSADYWSLVAFVLLTYLFANLKNICFQILRADYRSREFLIVSCSEFLFCAGLNIWLVVFQKMGPAGIVYSNLIGAGVAVVLATRFVPQTIRAGFDFDRAKEMVRFGVPLIPQAVFVFLLGSADRFLFVYLLGEDAGLAASGVYGSGAQVASILEGVLLMPFMMFWPSVYYEIGKRPTGSQDLGRCATYYAAVAGFLAVGLAMSSRPLVIGWFDKAYHDAWRAVPLLAFALALYGMSDVTKVGLMISGATRRMPLFVAGAAIVSIGLGLLLIPRFGLMGAAVASLCAYATLAILVGIGAGRHYRIQYEWGRLFRILVVCVALTVVAYRWPLAGDLTKFELVLDLLRRGAVAACAYPALLLLMGFVTPREREILREYAGRWFRRKH